ncbi:unnamed protein product [Soboliphyme baturini]|uniref:Uncharacterized protein n=1 Tax=Soboliphyme baturini TaxID=241478 RepID=A0A183II77_9BILA|nr:unnamed protein product [Soboliphyme baturini]
MQWNKKKKKKKIKKKKRKKRKKKRKKRKKRKKKKKKSKRKGKKKSSVEADCGFVTIVVILVKCFLIITILCWLTFRLFEGFSKIL